MAALYRAARLHLYPGHPDDMACWTLMETQACGLPAVARPLGAVHERLRDGQTGQTAPDDEAFANVAIRLLSDDQAFWSMSRDAHLLQRDRSWDVVAAEFDALFKVA
jgi:glycosyltransferase involved in cell wall biosynthesis